MPRTKRNGESLRGRVLLSPHRVARMLDVTPGTLMRWVMTEQFPRPMTLPGNDLRWLKVVVLAWSLTRPLDGPGKKV